MDFDKPDAAELLDIGRDLLLRELLPALPAAQRYSALMLANALAIAARESRVHAAADVAVEKAERSVYEQEGRSDLEQRLATDIRSGQLSDSDTALRSLLLQQTLYRLRLSNPRHLQSHGLEPGEE